MLNFGNGAFPPHQMRMLPIQRISLILALAVSIASLDQGTAQNVLRPDRVLYFSAGWRVNGPLSQNVLQLGTIFRCGVAWCVQYEEFAGKDNLPRVPLPYKHEMAAPYGAHRCTDEHLTTILGVIHSDLAAKAIDNERGFVLRVDNYEYTWERDTSPAGGLVLVKARGSGNDMMFDQPIGFAYESEDRRGGRLNPAT